jgi:Periplasmic component of the Tol biopolymer transport system
VPVNPTFDIEPTKVQIWSISFEGGEPVLLGDGENPTISPDGKQVAFTKSRQIWVTNIDGSSEAKKLFVAKGGNGQPKWSPDGLS